MDFTASTKTWKRGLSAVQNAVGNHLVNPLVENIHISCENGTVRFLATNLNLTIRCEGEADVQEPGEIIIPSKLIVNLVRDLPADDVNFSEREGKITLYCGKFEGRLKGLSAEYFPPFMPVSEGISFELAVSILKEIIRKTIFATSSEKIRYELDGLKMDIEDKQLKVYATDGRRLAFYKLEDIDLPEGKISVMIPSATLHELQRSLPDEGSVLICLQERKAQFTCGDTTLISNLLQDNFPQVERIIPRDGNQFVTANRKEFLSAVKRTSNLTSIETNMLLIRFEKGYLTIHGEREEVGGEGKDVVITNYHKNEIELRLNYRYLIDFLRAIDEEEIEIELFGDNRACVFRGKENNNYLYVLMPMKPPKEEEQAA